MDTWNVAAYPKPLTMMESIAASFGGSSPDEEKIFAGTPLAPTAKVLMGWSRRIRDGRRDLWFARLPYDIVID